MRCIFGLCLALAALARAGAQTTETPVPFDSAHRVLVITPALAERLRLADPAWPVRDEYRDVASVCVVAGRIRPRRAAPHGSLKRYELTEAQRVALGAAIDLAMADVGPTDRPSRRRALGARGKWLRAEDHGADRARLRTVGRVAQRRRLGGGRDLRAHDRCRVLRLVRRGAERSDHARTGRSFRQPRRRGGCRWYRCRLRGDRERRQRRASHRGRVSARRNDRRHRTR